MDVTEDQIRDILDGLMLGTIEVPQIVLSFQARPIHNYSYSQSGYNDEVPTHYKRACCQYKSWANEEEIRLLEGVKQYGTNFDVIKNMLLPNRNVGQVRSKYFMIIRKQEGKVSTKKSKE